jgi:hypothetical protein
MHKLNIFVLSTVVLLSACSFGNSGSVATETSSAYPWPADEGECVLVTKAATTVYSRPSVEAAVFGEVEPGFEAIVGGRTDDGWVGFDPGVAQAANMGVFRLRWVHFDEVELNGGCIAVPVSWVPQPDACYTMPMEPVTVYSEADVDSGALAILDVDDFAAVIGITGDGWAQVDLGLGNTGLTGIGWVEESTLNLNGPCDSF